MSPQTSQRVQGPICPLSSTEISPTCLSGSLGRSKMMRHVHSLSWDNDRVQDDLITWQIAKDNGNQPIRKGGAKGFKKAIAALEEQGLGECLQVATVKAFKAAKPWP